MAIRRGEGEGWMVGLLFPIFICKFPQCSTPDRPKRPKTVRHLSAERRHQEERRMLGNGKGNGREAPRKVREERQGRGQ